PCCHTGVVRHRYPPWGDGRNAPSHTMPHRGVSCHLYDDVVPSFFTNLPQKAEPPPGRPLDRAKTGVMISNRCASVSGSAALAGSRCASGGGTEIAVIVGRRRWRLRSVWRWAARGYAGSWRIVRPRVAVPWVCVSTMASG